MDVLGDAKSFVCRQSSYKKQKLYYTVNSVIIQIFTFNGHEVRELRSQG